jgi:hypothetical protein
VSVDPEGDYFRRVVDYVHLNPVRAGLASVRSGLDRYSSRLVNDRRRRLARDRALRAARTAFLKRANIK